MYLLNEAEHYACGWPDELPRPRNPSSHEEFAVIDCIDFNERFRFGDPVSDIAFLAMDLIFHGRRDLVIAFTEEYFSITQDEPGCGPAAVLHSLSSSGSAEVEGIQLWQPEMSDAEGRAAASRRARAHWLLALGELECPNRRPLLVMVGGLPGYR